jgi:hypothetical protein
MKKHHAPVDQLVDTSKLYEHLVNDHGWEARPYLINQRLHDLHRLEHTEAGLGLVSLEHDHETSVPPVVALPLVGTGFGGDLPQAA